MVRSLPVVDRQQALHILFLRQTHTEPVVADGFLQLPQRAFIRTGFFIQWEHQHKFAGGGRGELNGV